MQNQSKEETYKAALHSEASRIMSSLGNGKGHVMYTLNLLKVADGESAVSHEELAKVIKKYGLNTDVPSYVGLLCYDLKVAVNTGDEISISPVGKICLRYDEAQIKSGAKLF